MDKTLISLRKEVAKSSPCSKKTSVELYCSICMNFLTFFFFNNCSKTSFILGLQLANPHIHQITWKEAFQGEFHLCGPHPNLQMKNKDSTLQKKVWFLDPDKISVWHGGELLCFRIQDINLIS